jgi:hypothetical protein
MGEIDEIKVFADAVVHEGRLTHMTLRYEAASGTWTHSFTAEALGQSEIRGALTHAGLSYERHLDPDTGWLLARPASFAQRGGPVSSTDMLQ